MNSERKEEGAPFLFLVHRGWRLAPVLPEAEECAADETEALDQDRQMEILRRIPSGGLAGGESGVCRRRLDVSRLFRRVPENGWSFRCRGGV